MDRQKSEFVRALREIALAKTLDTAKEIARAAVQVIDDKSNEELFREDQIIALAKEKHEKEGAIEFDEDAVVSEGDDNGAYVTGWIWVDFAGTELDTENK